MQLGYTQFLIIGDCAVSKEEITAIQWGSNQQQIIVTLRGGRQILTGCKDKKVLDSLFTKPKSRRLVNVD